MLKVGIESALGAAGGAVAGWGLKLAGAAITPGAGAIFGIGYTLSFLRIELETKSSSSLIEKTVRFAVYFFSIVGCATLGTMLYGAHLTVGTAAAMGVAMIAVSMAALLILKELGSPSRSQSL